MKSKFFGVSLGSTVFILMIVTVLAVVRPAYLRICALAEKYEFSLGERLRDSTGLTFSYQSLSPSIFASLKINRIEVKDAESNQKILEIKKAVLSFDFFKFFSKNPVMAFETLSLNGVTFEYDAIKESQMLQNIRQIANAEKKQKKKAVVEVDKKSPFTLEGKTFDLPFELIVKNLSFHYSDLQNDALVTLKKLEFKDYSGENGLVIKTSGKASFSNEKIRRGKNRAKISCGFSVSGTLFENFEGSSALISLSGATGADYSISHLDMLVSYADEKLEVRTMRTVLPFSLFAQADFQSQTLNFSGTFDKFDPFSLVYVRNKSDLMKKISGSSISGTVSSSLSKENIEYRTAVSLFLSEKLLGDSAAVKIDFHGDRQNVVISRIKANGSFIDADFSGNFYIPYLQPSGLLSLNYLTLNNGGIISTEVYIDPYKKGFMCFAPQFFMNEKSFTALQLTVIPEVKSVDFTFEMFDYAHADFEENGRILFEGSFLTGKEKYIQSHVTVSNMFIDSVMNAVSFFTSSDGNNRFGGMMKTLEPYIFTTDFYVSSDFKNVSCNAPYCLVANTEKERELLFFSVDGSNQTFQLSQCEIQFGKQSAFAEASVDFINGFQEFSLVSDITVNSVPYHFSGNFTPEWISVSGDYGFDAVLSLGSEISGTLQFRQLPIAVGKSIVSATTDCSFSWNFEDGIAAQVMNFELERTSANLGYVPHFFMSGNVSRYGFMINSFSFADENSNLSGTGSILWNVYDGIFDSVHVAVSGASDFTAEKLNLSADFTNPNKLAISKDMLLNEVYMSVQASVLAFPVGRLLGFQTAENTITADFTASGTFSNPFISVMLHNASLSVGGYPLSAKAEFVMDDVGMNLSNVDCTWSSVHLSSGAVFFDPVSFTGNATAEVDIGSSLKIPLSVELSAESSGKRFIIPEYYNAIVSASGISGNLLKNKISYGFTLVHTPGRFDIVTDDDEKIRGFYEVSDGNMFFYAGKKSIVQFAAAGKIKNSSCSVDISGISSNLKTVSSLINFPVVQFSSGFLSGNLAFSGQTSDPEISGQLRIDSPSFLIQPVSKSLLHTDKLVVEIVQNEAVLPKTLVYLGNGAAYVNANLEFSRWKFNSLTGFVKSTGRKGLPINMNYPFVHLTGRGNVDMKFQLDFPRDFSVTGTGQVDNADVEIVMASLQKQFSINTISLSGQKELKPPPVDVSVELDITVGQKVQCMFNPLLRGLIVPGTKFSLFVDSVSGDYEVKSDINLRGGEIAWLNRSFYMKEGKISLNESKGNFDPRITVLAETRERDDNGSLVTVTLSARNQLFSMFNPLFTSTPPRSEKEIMQILGQLASTDSESMATLAVAGGDYLVQTTVIRGIENTLRELLNFDIFSIRTNVLQNSVKYRMNRKSSTKQTTFGNFVDNSSVYVGKYLGSSLYVDTLLHWSYDDTKDDDGNTVKGITFQPEIGFEMSSPFVNIRLGVAPNIESFKEGIQGMIVPSTFMTLSWKHSF